MNTTKILLSLAVVVLLGLGGWLGWWVFFGQEQPAESVNDQLEEPAETDPEPEILEVEPPAVIEAEHEFSDGQHRITGILELPTPCHSLDLEVDIQESDPETAILRFQSGHDGSEVCAQVIETVSFSQEFQASAEAEIIAEFDGQPVELILTTVETEEPADREPEPDEFIKE